MRKLHGDLLLLGLGASGLAMFATPALLAEPGSVMFRDRAPTATVQILTPEAASAATSPSRPANAWPL